MPQKVVYGFAELDDIDQAEAGTENQEDFGVLSNGEPRVALESACGRNWCLKDDAQYMPFGSVRVKVSDKRPSNPALTWIHDLGSFWQAFKSKWSDGGQRSKEFEMRKSQRQPKERVLFKPY